MLFIYDHLFSVLGFGLCLLLAARLLSQRARPSVSIAWLLAIILIPYVGVPLYLVFGGRKLAKVRVRKRLFPETHPARAPEATLIDEAEGILVSAGLPSSRRGGRLTFIPDGQHAHYALHDLLASARESIHVITFILGRDEVAREIIDSLSKKAAEGIKVRLLLDALGCFWARGAFLNGLRKAGGNIGVFMPVLPIRNKGSANLRNHRKMVIVDGRAAIIGGMNLSHKYMGAEPDPERWLDTAILIEGPAVNDLEDIFADDWQFATDEKLDPVPPFVPADPSTVPTQPIVQIAPCGPDVPEDSMHEALLAACLDAQKRIWIITPYFIPDEVIFRSLLFRSRLGRDVTVILPKHSDHIIADWAREPFLRQMKENGVRVLLYGGGMIHAKHVLFDDNLALAGSLNFDMRSLFLNYEVGAFIRSAEDVKTISDWMTSLAERCEEYVPAEVGYIKGWIEDISVLVSPLL